MRALDELRRALDHAVWTWAELTPLARSVVRVACGAAALMFALRAVLWAGRRRLAAARPLPVCAPALAPEPSTLPVRRCPRRSSERLREIGSHQRKYGGSWTPEMQDTFCDIQKWPDHASRVPRIKQLWHKCYRGAQ
jgi:hypothetical protein